MVEGRGEGGGTKERCKRSVEALLEVWRRYAFSVCFGRGGGGVGTCRRGPCKRDVCFIRRLRDAQGGRGGKKKTRVVCCVWLCVWCGVWRCVVCGVVCGVACAVARGAWRVVWCGVVWCGAVWCGAVRCSEWGGLWCGVVRVS